jgi:NADH dehydrogenase
MQTTEPKPRYIVVGGGLAGTTLVRELQHKLPTGYRMLLISEESYTTFHPMLPEAVGASIFPEHVVAPLREIVAVADGHRFIMGRVTGVNEQACEIRCETLVGEQTIRYEQLVLAFGNRARIDFIPGMSDHALPLKTIGDAMEIRNTVLRRLAQSELESDPAVQQRLAHFTVIGGGFSGVEVASELIDCLHSIRHYYTGVKDEWIGVTLIQDLDRLLPELPASLGRAALKSLERRGVRVLLNKRASAIAADGVSLGENEIVTTGSVICTIGTRPNDLIEQLGLPIERGRLVTSGDMSVADHPGIWALGDCAAVPNALDDKISPPTAQFAVRQAQLLAKNLLQAIAGEKTTKFNYKAQGTMAAIGHMKGVAQVWGIPLSGLWAWLLWRAYYLSQMPTLGRKVRIYVEWTWGMFFPADITHLRFSRSRDNMRNPVSNAPQP